LIELIECSPHSSICRKYVPKLLIPEDVTQLAQQGFPGALGMAAVALYWWRRWRCIGGGGVGTLILG